MTAIATPRKPVIWLTGYPSSGLLKVQIIIANLLYGRVKSIVDLDQKVRCLPLSGDIESDPLERDVECPPRPTGQSVKVEYEMPRPGEVPVNSEIEQRHKA